tara:strand:+ start:54 stop:455 length:402 start_codon:yes stop_codon:yes gene_type:complete
MKGSPFQRNFGIGASPVKQGLKKEGKKLQKTLSTVDPDAPGTPGEPGYEPPASGPSIPKGHPVTPPTTEQSKKSKGTVRGRTGFQSDVVDPVKSKVRQGVNFLNNTVIAKGQQKVNETILKGGKKVKDYFTKK